MSPTEPESQDLIERSNVPDLERLAMQEMLNGMTRRGELSGPPLKEDGKDSQLYQDRLREREARMAILDTVIESARPAPAAFATARRIDLLALEQAREQLPFIPDGSYHDVTPKAACLKKIRELETIFQAKWDVGAVAVSAVDMWLGEPPAPGSLILSDGCFDYPALERHLNGQRHAEEAISPMSKSDPDYLRLKERVDTYRAAIIAGLAGLVRATPAPTAATPAPHAPETPRAEPARRPVAKEAPVLPPNPEEAAFLAWCREVDSLPHERHVEMLEALDRAPTDLDDRKLGYLASAIVLEKLEALTPELADRLDARGLRAVHDQIEQPELREMSPRDRMAIVKRLAGRAGINAEARGALAGAFAAGLVRQHPRALTELLEHTQGPNKGPVMHAMAKRLSDDEIVAFGREAMHAFYKAIGAPSTDEARRQSARLVRLSNKK